MPTVISVNAVPAAPAGCASASKAQSPAAEDAAGASSSARVQFTLGDSSQSADAGKSTAQKDRAGKSAHPLVRHLLHLENATSGPDSTLQSLVVAPATVAAAASNPASTGDTDTAVAGSQNDPAAGVAAEAFSADSGSTVAASATAMTGAATTLLKAMASPATAAGTKETSAKPLPSSSPALPPVTPPNRDAADQQALPMDSNALRVLRQETKSASRPSNAMLSVSLSGASESPAPDPAAGTANAESTQKPATQDAAAGMMNPTASTTSAASSAAGSSGSSASLFAAFAQTLSDTTAAQPDGADVPAQSAQAMPAAFSSLLKQINDGGTRTAALLSTLGPSSAPADTQLASALSTALSTALSAGAALGLSATPVADAGVTPNDPNTASSEQAPIDTTQQNWADALGGRVEWLMHQGLQEARIELHPQDMGSINVHIKLGSDGAEVQFAATNPNVRDALESSLPKLREMLAGSGLHLAQAQVGAQMQQQDSSGRFLQQHAAKSTPSFSGATTHAEPPPQPQVPRVKVAQVSIIDDYA